MLEVWPFQPWLHFLITWEDFGTSHVCGGSDFLMYTGVHTNIYIKFGCFYLLKKKKFDNHLGGFSKCDAMSHLRPITSDSLGWVKSINFQMLFR